MEYTSMIAEFGSRYGLEDLVPDENGAVGFESDGRPVVIRKRSDSETVIVTIGLGPVVEEAETSVNRFVLRANQALMAQDGAAVCLDPEADGYSLVCSLDIASLDFIDFDRKLAALLDRAEQCAAMLENLGVLASSAEVDGLYGSGEEEADGPAEPTPLPVSGWDALRQLSGAQV